MKSASRSVFDSVNSINDVLRLIEEGEAENSFLECKSPDQPFLNRELKITLAKAISGFSNTSGGLIIWGVSTTRKSKSGLDVLTQIEYLGSCKKFSTEILNKIPTLTNPPIKNYENKIIRLKNTDTRGIILSYIPQVISDPVQSALDNHFYYRSGDDFILTPYSMLKRLFASSESPDLSTFVDDNLVKLEQDGFWEIPVTISNNSSAVAENAKINIIVVNSEACSELKASGMNDISKFNPGKKIFSNELDTVVHRGFNIIIGHLRLKMAGRRKKIILKINIFANKMRAKSQLITVNVYKNKVFTKIEESTFLY